MPGNITVEGSSLIPKNPWVAVAVLGGVALVGYVIFEEFQKLEKSTTNALGDATTSLTSAPGALISSTLGGAATGVQSVWDTLIYNPIKNLFGGTSSAAGPSATTPTTNTQSPVGAS